MTEKRLRKRGLFGRETVTTFLPPHSNYVRQKYKVDDKNGDYEDVAEETFGGNLTPRIVLQCPNSLDGIEGFCFLGLRWAYKNSPFFSGDKIGLQRTSETGF